METIIEGIQLSLSLEAFAAILIGLILGQFLGMIPGLNASMGAAILIPYSLYFDPWISLPMLIGMFKGTYFANSITAVLISTPGTPSAAATVFDGYPLAQQGKSGKALHTALYSAIFGDTFSDIVLIVAAGLLAMVAVKFGPPEYALLVLFAFLTLGSLAGKKIWKGLVSVSIGVLLGCIGEDPMLGTPRLVFGLDELRDGLPLIPMLLGFLALSEVFLQMERPVRELAAIAVPRSHGDDGRLTWSEFKALLPLLFRSSVLGTGIGILPGLGATIAAFLAYNDARSTSKTPEKFGSGSLEGVAAPEAAGNAVMGANLIPLLAFGIPGDVVAAILLSAFVVQGITPGPLVFQENPKEIYAIFSAMMIANGFLFFTGKLFIVFSRVIVLTPKRILFPPILILATAGAYASRNSLFDVFLVFVFGVLGYALRKLAIPPIPLLIGFILTPIIESSVRRTMILASTVPGGMPVYLAHRPIFLILLAVLFGVTALLARKHIMRFSRWMSESTAGR